MVEETCSYQREHMNKQWPDPRRCVVDNRVMACRAARLDKKKSIVNKAQYAFTGLWEII